ncbi:MAG: right-handed parallel beta-helix repeat-containing protein [Armatimonadota bacterium]|nr:right-handed parallel beta-helix repeat-containing protein [Armatimonadota bacterium]
MCIRSAAALVIALIGLATTSGSPAGAAEYYLSPDGEDDAAGDRDDPWRSIEKANATLEPGDTAIFLAGEYSGTIAPANSGTAGAPITYRSAKPWAAHLVADDVPWLMQLAGQEHIIIEGFSLDGRSRAGWLTIDGCRHLTIRGCNMRRARPLHWIRNCSEVKLLDNVFDKGAVTGDMFHMENCSRVLIEGNSFTRVGHCPLILSQTRYTVVRANAFRAEWGRNYSFWSSGRLLIEGNIITRARDSAWSADPYAKNLYDDSIFRHNRVFDNLGTPLNTSSYIWRGVSPTGRYRWPFRAMNSRFYHNTFTDNLGPAWVLGGMNVSAHIFQNNIFYRNDPLGGNVQVVRGDGISRDNRFVSNLFRGTEPGQTVVRYGSDYWTAQEANENTFTVGGFWSEFHANIDADPAFTDPDNRDYRLRLASEAIDAGAPLALAIGNGTGSELPVTDGRPFYDGFGIEGEEGDFIAIDEGDNLAQIQRVELRYYQPAILHLDREVSWEDGMPVSLPWTGEAPDLGAYEHGVEHPTRLIALARPAVVEPGQPVQFSLDTLGKEIASVIWGFEDGSYAREATPAKTYADAGCYGVTVRTTFENGRRGVDVVVVEVREQEAPGVPMVEVDFEDATRGTRWGYYFKFYRGHQTGASHIQRPDGDGKCMHLYYDDERANRTAGQIAPGAWDIDDYPLIRFDYRVPEGVPVAIEVTTYGGPDQPGGFTLGGSASRHSRHEDLDLYTLVDDGRWHEITVDVRTARQAYPELQYLRQFMFHTGWTEDRGQEFWFDDFAILHED